MKDIIRAMKSKPIGYVTCVFVGILFGWLGFSGRESNQSNGITAEQDAEPTVWICSMHPQIVMDSQGKCPLCAMDLIPRQSTSTTDESIHPDAIQMSAEAIALANIQTTRVTREMPTKSIRLYGKIVPDERALQTQTAHISGRIERLHIDFTGESVRAGQPLATIYSPELLTAQQELLQAAAIGQSHLLQAAREKLRLWHLTTAQIEGILASGIPSPLVEIKATSSGVVISKRVSRGDYVTQGAVLLDIANLSRVWAVFDVFEADLPFIKVGDIVRFSLAAYPGKEYSGKVSFVDPVLNPNTRTARIRVDVDNGKQEFKPEMYAMAELQAEMSGEYAKSIVVPQTAVLWTGKRSIVYVRENSITPAFLMREVVLGPALGGSYIVLEGLDEGEEVVTNGVFTIDASAQLEGKISMMNSTSIPSNAQQAEFGTSGACDMCRERIERAAQSVVGVYSAVWSDEHQQLKVSYDSKRASKESISKAVAKAGHDTDFHKADDAVYESLPGCCQYR